MVDPTGVRALALASALGFALAACTARGASGPQQPEVCRIYVECAASATPADAGALLELYGSQGTCWKGTVEEAALCEQDCSERLDELREQFPGDDSCEQVAGTSEGTSEGESEGEGESESDTDTVPIPSSNEVDILFVVDNSGTMGTKQGNLVRNIESFVDALDGAGASYRIGVTTTDNGNPWCASTGPESGKLQLTSCRTRQNEFIFTGNPPADATAIACTDHCEISELEVQPTPTATDPNPRPRPWIERIDGVANVASPVDALRCVLPQGIAGCGFEAPLESLYKAVLRAENESETQYGFLRETAMLAVVVLTDEVDCSYNSEYDSIFLPPNQGGNDVFWEDPNGAAPTSAVCWNAGVACTGGPGTYEECHAESYDLDGNPGASDDDAVLHPISRYVAFLQNLEDVKLDAAGHEVFVAMIAGVPAGYETGTAEIVYAESPNAQYNLDFGIGPGCTNDAASPPLLAIPPVREREVAESFTIDGARNLYSACADDYSPALAAIASTIVSRLAG